MPIPFNVYEFFRFIIPGAYFVASLYTLLALLLKFSISFDVLSYDTVAFFFASLVVSVVIDSRDVIQYSQGWLEEADFFQHQFPSRYLLDRCGKCETEPCSNRLSKSNYINTWFFFFNEHIPEYLRNAVLSTGYLCRVVFYGHLFSLLFFYLGMLYPLISYFRGVFSFWTFTYPGIMLIITEGLYLANNVSRKGKGWPLFLRALNPARLLITAGLVFGLLKHQRQGAEPGMILSDLEAKGLWPRWKTYNEVEVRWMEMNEALIREKVCKEVQPKGSDPDLQSLSELPKGEKVFETELKLIMNNEIRNLVVEVLRLAPGYFWQVPSSPSGKHHPPDENKPGGKVLHTKRTVYIAYQLARMENLSQLETDLLLGAMLIHDIYSQGPDDLPLQKTDPNHPLLIRKKTGSLEGLPYYDDIMSIVEAHMGRWGPVTPESKLQWLAHIADYIPSRKEVRIDVHYEGK
jgi:hypothetical protein